MNKYVLFLLASVIVASFSQVLLKKSARRSYDSFLKEYLNWYVIVGYGMMVGSTLLTIFAYRGLAYKNGPIIESVGYLFILVLSYFFFQEKITLRKIAGVALILAGILVFYL